MKNKLYTSALALMLALGSANVMASDAGDAAPSGAGESGGVMAATVIQLQEDGVVHTTNTKIKELGRRIKVMKRYAGSELDMRGYIRDFEDAQDESTGGGVKVQPALTRYSGPLKAAFGLDKGNKDRIFFEATDVEERELKDGSKILALKRDLSWKLIAASMVIPTVDGSVVLSVADDYYEVKESDILKMGKADEKLEAAKAVGLTEAVKHVLGYLKKNLSQGRVILDELHLLKGRKITHKGQSLYIGKNREALELLRKALKASIGATTVIMLDDKDDSILPIYSVYVQEVFNTYFREDDSDSDDDDMLKLLS